MGDSIDRQDLPYTEFTPVRSKKKRRQRSPNKEPPGAPVLLQRLRTQMQEDNWLSKSLQLIDTALATYSFPVTEILCLGLGSPSLSLNARVQLAFLLALCDHLHIDYAKVAIYDPVFAADDLALLESLQMRPLTENRNAEYKLTQPTICYMPHCDIELYENITKANWDRVTLPNLFLIANRFADYVERVPHLLQLVPLLEITPLPVCEAWPSAFNNLSVQFTGQVARLSEICTIVSTEPPVGTESAS